MIVALSISATTNEKSGSSKRALHDGGGTKFSIRACRVSSRQPSLSNTSLESIEQDVPDERVKYSLE